MATQVLFFKQSPDGPLALSARTAAALTSGDTVTAPGYIRVSGTAATVTVNSAATINVATEATFSVNKGDTVAFT